MNQFRDSFAQPEGSYTDPRFSIESANTVHLAHTSSRFSVDSTRTIRHPYSAARSSVDSTSTLRQKYSDPRQSTSSETKLNLHGDDSRFSTVSTSTLRTHHTTPRTTSAYFKAAGSADYEPFRASFVPIEELDQDELSPDGTDRETPQNVTQHTDTLPLTREDTNEDRSPNVQRNELENKLPGEENRHHSVLGSESEIQKRLLARKIGYDNLSRTNTLSDEKYNKAPLDWSGMFDATVFDGKEDTLLAHERYIYDNSRQTKLSDQDSLDVPTRSFTSPPRRPSTPVLAAKLTRPDTPTLNRPGPGSRQKPFEAKEVLAVSNELKPLFTAASLYEFNIDRSKKEAGIPYLTYISGEIFDVIGERGELWLARNQDDPKREIGWIWSLHFARISTTMTSHADSDLPELKHLSSIP